MANHAYAPVPTPVGPALVAWTAKGVSALALGDDRAAFAARYQARTGHAPQLQASPPAALAAAVDRALDGGDPGDLAYDLDGLSPFTRAVLAATASIPRGETRSYRWVADRIGQPKAARAVGGALGRNPVPLLIPCHRVVREDRTLGGFALGPHVKQALLDREGALLPRPTGQLAAV